MNLKFTIIIPCYNAEKWIEESLKSALHQTYENVEVIVVDNESTDNSYQILKDIQMQYPTLKILTAPNLYKYAWDEPVGAALEIFTGDYFTVLGADDYISKDYVESIVQILSGNTHKIKLLQSPIMGIDSEKRHKGLLGHSYKNISEFKERLFKDCPVTTPSVVYSRELYDEGLIQWKGEKYLGAGDYNLYFEFADKNLFIYPVPRWLGYHYRWHHEQSTWGMQREFSEVDVKIREHWKQKWSNE